jgi:hypothetical protein
MWDKIKDLLKWNLPDVLFAIAISFLFLCAETIGFLLMLNLVSTMGLLGFMMAFTGMLFILFIYLFMMVSIWENL